MAEKVGENGRVRATLNDERSKDDMLVNLMIWMFRVFWNRCVCV